MAPVVHRAAVTLALVAALSACTTSPTSPNDPNPYVPQATLKAEEASRLRLPGAEFIREVGGERFMNITGPEPAFVGAVWGTQVDEAAVQAFYDRELLRLDWRRDSAPPLSSGEIRVWGWCKPTMFYRLAIFDPSRYERVGVAGAERFKTVIDARVMSNNLECPLRPRTFPPVPSSR